MLCCKERVSLDQLKQMETPNATDTHQPIPHYEAVSTVLNRMSSMNYELTADPEIGISHEGSRCYWLFKVANDIMAKAWGTIIGGRNSHDKVFSFDIFGGYNVFICENMMATGEVKVGTKHTVHVYDRFTKRVDEALMKIDRSNLVNQDRIAKYKEFTLPREDFDNEEILNDKNEVIEIKQTYESSPFMNDFVIKSMYKGIISPSSTKKVLDQWKQPKYEEFTERNAWSLSNAYTETFKGYDNPSQAYQRGIKLTSMIDELVGFPAQHLNETKEIN